MTEQAAQPRSTWRKVWEFPLVVMVVALICIAAPLALLVAAGAVFEAGSGYGFTGDPGLAIQAFLVVAVAIAAYKLLVARLGRKPSDEMRFEFKGLREAAQGVGIGAAVMIASFLLVLAIGGYEVRGFGGASDTVELLFVAGLYAGIVEEIIFRGIIFRWLEELAGSWVALILSAFLFGIVHWTNPNATLFSSLAIAIEAGLLLGAVYMLTRSLWMPIGLHFGWNVTQGWVLDVPVSGMDNDGLLDSAPVGDALISGGSFGLEASMICLTLATLVGLWLLRRALQAGELRLPMWSRQVG